MPNIMISLILVGFTLIYYTIKIRAKFYKILIKTRTTSTQAAILYKDK